MKTIVAIDPGASGGIAFQHGDGKAACMPMPETEGDILDILRTIKNESAFEETEPVAFVEEVGGYTAGNPAPGSAMFNFGRGFGFILGVLQSHKYRVELVRPQKWQQPLGIGKASGCAKKTEWKGKLKEKAQQLYPHLKVTLKTADALLILEHGRKQGL